MIHCRTQECVQMKYMQIAGRLILVGLVGCVAGFSITIALVSSTTLPSIVIAWIAGVLGMVVVVCVNHVVERFLGR